MSPLLLLALAAAFAAPAVAAAQPVPGVEAGGRCIAPVARALGLSECAFRFHQVAAGPARFELGYEVVLVERIDLIVRAAGGGPSEFVWEFRFTGSTGTPPTLVLASLSPGAKSVVVRTVAEAGLMDARVL